MPCCRSMHSDATSVVSVTPWQGGAHFAGLQAWGLERPLQSLTLVAPSTSTRAVPELAASTERDLAGHADSSGRL